MIKSAVARVIFLAAMAVAPQVLVISNPTLEFYNIGAAFALSVGISLGLFICQIAWRHVAVLFIAPVVTITALVLCAWLTRSQGAIYGCIFAGLTFVITAFILGGLVKLGKGQTFRL